MTVGLIDSTMPTPALARRPSPGTNRRPESAFELQVLPRDDIGYGLALFRSATPASDGRDARELVVRIWGIPLRSIVDHVLAAIRHAGYRTTDLKPTRRAPFRLSEEDGVRLGLLFLALKPLRKHRRIEEVSRAIATMEQEEVYYWFSKGTAGADLFRVQRALRIMASDE